MGGVCDRIGRVPVLFTGIILYALAGCSALVLSDLYAILVGRAFLGIAVAAILTSCTTLIGDFYEGHERDRFMGLQAAFMSFSGVIFPLASGALVSVSWRHPFLVYAFSLLILPGIWLSIREPGRHAHVTSIDSSDAPFPIWTLIMLFCLAAVQMISFFLIPTQFSFFLPPLVGASEMQVGLTLAGASLCIGSWSMMFHRIRKFVSPTGIVTISFLFIGIGYQILSRTDTWIGIGGGILIASVGLGILGPNITTWALGFTPERLRGRITGGIAASFFVGQFLSPILAEPLIRDSGISSVFNAVSVVVFVLSGVFAVPFLYGRVKSG
jgi:MFS family permease